MERSQEIHRTRNGLGLFTRTSSSDSGPSRPAEARMKVLDLAAAPGGKTTQLLSYLDNQGLLVSNEIHKGRSKILVENVERFGARNVLVTNESADRLAKVFSGFF